MRRYLLVIVGSGLLSACSGSDSPQLISAEVAAPETIPAVEVGELDATEPFGQTRAPEEMPTVDYAFADELQLPINNVGYSYSAGLPVPQDQIDRLAAFFRVPAESVERFDTDDAGSAAVGGGDGDLGITLGYSADDALQHWSYTDYNLSDPFINCSPSDSVPSSATTEVTQPADTDTDPDQQLEEQIEDAEPCDLPEASGVPPTVEEAENRVRNMLESLDAQVQRVEFESFADQFNTTVNVVERNQIDLATGREWSVSFGAEGRIVSASGTFAQPKAIGPFDLVDLDTAKQRIISGVNTFGGMGSPGADGSAGDSDILGGDASVPQSVRLVDVRADLIWVWDAANNAWLLPAFGFVDEFGNRWTVPAVPDSLFTDPGTVGQEATATTATSDSTLDTTSSSSAVDPSDDFDEDVMADPTLYEPLLGVATLSEFERAAAKNQAVVRVVTVGDDELAVSADQKVNRINVQVDPTGVSLTLDDLAVMTSDEISAAYASSVVMSIRYVG